MSRPLAVLRPEPGNSATAARIEAAGRRAIRLPLFAVRAIDWRPPDAGDFDALVLTSANTARYGGAALARFAALPVYGVGEATAAAARDAGLSVTTIGTSDGAALLARAAAAGVTRALLLGGRDRKLASGGIVARAIAVYASDALPADRDAIGRAAGSVALLHSPRAATRWAELVDAAAIDRAAIGIAAISAAAAAAAGPGWNAVAIAAEPSDAATVAAAIALAD